MLSYALIVVIVIVLTWHLVWLLLIRVGLNRLGRIGWRGIGFVGFRLRISGWISVVVGVLLRLGLGGVGRIRGGIFTGLGLFLIGTTTLGIGRWGQKTGVVVDRLLGSDILKHTMRLGFLVKPLKLEVALESSEVIVPILLLFIF